MLNDAEPGIGPEEICNDQNDSAKSSKIQEYKNAFRFLAATTWKWTLRHKLDYMFAVCTVSLVVLVTLLTFTITKTAPTAFLRIAEL